MKHLLIALVLLSSCSAEQRIARILKRNPELVKRDTIFRKDTIFTKTVQKDTTFFYNSPDTVYMNEGKLQVKYFYNRHDSTIFLSGKCISDTIYKSYPIYISQVSVSKALKWHERLKLWFVNNILLIVLILAILGYIFRKVLKVWFPFLG